MTKNDHKIRRNVPNINLQCMASGHRGTMSPSALLPAVVDPVTPREGAPGPYQNLEAPSALGMTMGHKHATPFPAQVIPEDIQNIILRW